MSTGKEYNIKNFTLITYEPYSYRLFKNGF